MLESMLATYTRLVFGLTATPYGLLPTLTVLTTLLVLPSITETVLERELATYIILLF